MAKILIVDDRESNLFTLESILKRLDVEIVKTMSGDEALRATLYHDFALAILDVQMPGMDGYELAGLMRSDDTTRKIPIIFMSAVYSDEKNVFKGYESGAVDFITKPFNSEVLLSKVRVFLELDEQKTELARQKAEVERKNALIEGINKVLRESILCETVEDAARTCLSVAEGLTGSKFGFIAEIDENGLLHDIALSDSVRNACATANSGAPSMVQNMAIRGLWEKVIRGEGSPIVHDLSSHHVNIGVPAGHPALEALLGVPLKDADKKTFGMIALANKKGGYDQSDLEAIESLSVAFGEALLHKKAQELLRKSRDELEIRVQERTAKLEKSNRELQEFAFVASHDLQEPLRKIRTFGDLLKRSIGSSLSGEKSDYLERMQRSSSRMQDLISDLLKYSRVVDSPESLTAISLKKAALEAVADLKMLTEETGGEILVDELPSIEADPVQMRQLFQNLIGNALKYHGERPPKIHVYTRPSCADEFLEIYVEDNGIGFDEYYVDKIFKPFQRLHGRNSPYKGTGMGLAISRRIAERHGGGITAKSEPGKGAVFIVRLPIRHPEVEDLV